MLHPDEIEQLSLLLAGDLAPEQAAELWAEVERRPDLAEALAQLRGLEAVVETMVATQVPKDVVSRAISRAVPRRESPRWWPLAVAAALVVLVGVGVKTWQGKAPAPTPLVEVRRTETRLASVHAAPDAVVREEGEGISRLVTGTALYEGDFVVLADDERLMVHGKALISTNPREGLAHVTTLVTPTPEEFDMIRRASMQWATATTLAVLVLSGEVQAQTKVTQGEAWVKRPPSAAPVVKPTPPTPDAAAPSPSCESCAPATPDRPGTFEVRIGHSPSMGPADAKVTVVIFSEAECPFCVKSHEVLKELQKLYAGRVRFVFKHFPLPRHAGARQAAIALHAASTQGKFWEMLESAYGSPVAPEEGIYDAQARALGLDLQQYRRDVAAPETAAVIDADIAEGHRLGVQGVPAWFINGQEVVGHRSLESLRKLIDAQLAP